MTDQISQHLGMGMELELEETAITERTVLSERIALVNRRQKPVDEDRLIATLQRNPSASQVVSLHLSRTSLVKAMDIAAPLRKLQHVWITSPHLRDYEALRALPGLRGLTIDVARRSVRLPDLTALRISGVGIGPTLSEEPAMIGRMKSLRSLVLMYVWPERTLDALSSLRLHILEIKTSTISEVGDLDCRALDHVALRGCVRLTSVRGVDAESVDIDTCRKLDLSTVSGDRIKVLALRNMKRIEGMEFLKNCPNLRELEVTATRLSPNCVPHIAALRHLALAYLYGLKKRDLQQLSFLAKDAVVTDGFSTFRGGLEVDAEEGP